MESQPEIQVSLWQVLQVVVIPIFIAAFGLLWTRQNSQSKYLCDVRDRLGKVEGKLEVVDLKVDLGTKLDQIILLLSK